MIIPSEQVISTLASRLKRRMHNRPVLLVGAGASVSSGVPLARQCVHQIVRRHLEDALHVRDSQAIAKDDESVERWIRQQSWGGGYHDLAELFPVVVDLFLNPTALRTDFLISVITMDQLSEGYRHLGQLIERDVFKTIMTTNFDECLPSMFYERAPRSRLTEVGRWPGDVREFRMDNRQIIWMHGRLEQYSARNTVEEVSDLDPMIVGNAATAVREAPLVVVGYRGAEQSIMDKFFAAHAREPFFFKHGIYWCSPDRDMHPNVVELQNAVGDKDFFWLPIESFDRLMEDLNWSLIETDHSVQSVFRGWQPWVDCLVEDRLQLLVWSQRSRVWRKTRIERLRLTRHADGWNVHNVVTRNDMEHIQIASAVRLDGDFSVEFEVSGDVYEFKLQLSDLTDRNLYLNPQQFAIPNGLRSRFVMTRVGERLAVGVWQDARWRTLEFSFYDVDGKLKKQDMVRATFHASINIFRGAEITIHGFRVRTT